LARAEHALSLVGRGLAIVNWLGGLNRNNVTVSDPIKPNFHVSGIPEIWKNRYLKGGIGKGDINLFDGFTNPV